MKCFALVGPCRRLTDRLTIAVAIIALVLLGLLLRVSAQMYLPDSRAQTENSAELAARTQ